MFLNLSTAWQPLESLVEIWRCGAGARGLQETEMDAESIARKAMSIASDICVYTNGNLTVEIISK